MVADTRGKHGRRGVAQVPGRPPGARRDNRVRFWTAIARGATTAEASVDAGVSDSVGSLWFGHAGGMPPISLVPLAGRYLSFADREEIAVLHAQQHWMAAARPPRKRRRCWIRDRHYHGGRPVRRLRSGRGDAARTQRPARRPWCSRPRARSTGCCPTCTATSPQPSPRARARSPRRSEGPRGRTCRPQGLSPCSHTSGCDIGHNAVPIPVEPRDRVADPREHGHSDGTQHQLRPWSPAGQEILGETRSRTQSQADPWPWGSRRP